MKSSLIESDDDQINSNKIEIEKEFLDSEEEEKQIEIVYNQ